MVGYGQVGVDFSLYREEGLLWDQNFSKLTFDREF